jgi:Icc protein
MSYDTNSAVANVTNQGLWHGLKQRFRKWLSPRNVLNNNKLIIAQVTDMHIGATDNPYRGIPVRQQFVDVLQEVAKRPLDLLVLSGDLAAVAGEPEAYAWIRQVLATFPYPYVIMAGNHDHLGRMLKTFEVPASDVVEEMLCFSRTIKGRQLLFLDSSSYQLPPQQLDWLRAQLTTGGQKEVLLFIHHPPLLCDCRFMDERYPLQNIDEVWPVLVQLSQIKHIFCGHYHTEKTVVKAGKSVHLTPSTIFQIDTQSPYFVMKHTRPGWRMIEWQGSRVRTYVEYLQSGG